MKKRILIAGCGDLGAAVGALLVAQGHQVIGLRRSEVAVAQGIDYLQADLTRSESLCEVPTNVDLVLVIVTPSERSEAGYRAIYLRGVANLLAHFSAHSSIHERPPAPVIYVSSTRVYGQRGGEWVDEDSVCEPADVCGRILLAAEAQVMVHKGVNSSANNLVNNCGNSVVRFSGIYNRHSRFMQRLQGRPIQASPPLFTNRVHREDCVGSLLFLANKALAGEPLSALYLVSDNEPAPKWDVVAWLAQKANLPAPTKAPDASDAGQGKRCDNRRIREAGYVFKYPSYREGYQYDSRNDDRNTAREG
jgi:nucleoside-diphosphate-sugar epimerase